MITKIEVGKNFPLAKVQEGTMIDLKDEGLLVFIGLRYIKNEEEFEFRKGDLAIDLSYINGIMFFVLEIGDVILADIPFHAGLIRPIGSIERVIQRNDEGIYPLHIFLVDTQDNILKAMRVVGISPDFSLAVENFIVKQARKPFNADEYDKTLNNIFDTLSIPDILKMSTARYESKGKK